MAHEARQRQAPYRRPTPSGRRWVHAPGDTLERAVHDFALAERAAARHRREETERAVRDERLRRLEADVTELRGRIGGLIFAVLGSVVAQVAVRLFG